MKDLQHIEENDTPMLSGRNEHFPHPERLKRSELEGLDISLWDELCISTAEGETDESLMEYTDILNDEAFAKQVSEYQQLKLSGDESIHFSNKNSLKKQQPYHIGVWLSLAAAAAVIAVLTLPYFLANRAAPAIPQRATQLAATNSLPKTSHTQTNNQTTTDVSPVTTTTNNDIGRKGIAAQKENKNRPQTNTLVSGEEPVNSSTVNQPSSRRELAIAAEPIAHATQQPIATLAAADGVVLAPTPAIKVIQLADVPNDENRTLLGALAQRVMGKKPNKEANNPNALSLLAEKSIVGINRMLDKETVVVREYDSNGKLTLYAVQSSTIHFQKSYDN